MPAATGLSRASKACRPNAEGSIEHTAWAHSAWKAMGWCWLAPPQPFVVERGAAAARLCVGLRVGPDQRPAPNSDRV